jgi:hypothetical protein
MHPSFTPRRSPRLPRSLLSDSTQTSARPWPSPGTHERARWFRRENGPPAIAIVEPHSVLCGCQRVKLDHCFIVLYKYVLCLQLDTLQKHAIQFSERAIDECLLAEVMTARGWVPSTIQSTSSATCLKKLAPSPGFKFLGYCANLVFCDRHLKSPFYCNPASCCLPGRFR